MVPFFLFPGNCKIWIIFFLTSFLISPFFSIIIVITVVQVLQSIFHTAKWSFQCVKLTMTLSCLRPFPVALRMKKKCLNFVYIVLYCPYGVALHYLDILPLFLCILFFNNFRIFQVFDDYGSGLCIYYSLCPPHSIPQILFIW